MKKQLFWFGVVGVSAMLLHFALVTLVLVPMGVPPLVANVLGFLGAFQLSYWGHRRFTFEAGHVPHRQALPRFFGVSCLSFCVNEAMYFALLRLTPLDYRVSLAIVLFAVAALTFLLGKLWAFASAPQTN
ncbi:GtrA family protein [Chromobacterium piscinae]|uniref:GtrA family protein n=1 Tax=Chromobacterium piscinae TaxID=686831 RepID=A0ABV0H7I1_9NEIS|nr:GtrA family protein [Chromobacterium piscinae]MBX9297679.1 GtrA family protein [Chromobacterium vaccinii]MBX9347853.1 GtrA family protein [Chromobacterium vaccinii]MBX9357647.1 GtrA family protein [Chromobacterium vaccinii]MCD4504971.1 GtrA family protein [Chromobacterium piscinae]MCD5327635.1 GtrA family protein [Chromobacterium piscinae]